MRQQVGPEGQQRPWLSQGRPGARPSVSAPRHDATPTRGATGEGKQRRDGARRARSRPRRSSPEAWIGGRCGEEVSRWVEVARWAELHREGLCGRGNDEVNARMSWGGRGEAVAARNRRITHRIRGIRRRRSWGRRGGGTSNGGDGEKRRG